MCRKFNKNKTKKKMTGSLTTSILAIKFWQKAIPSGDWPAETCLPATWTCWPFSKPCRLWSLSRRWAPLTADIALIGVLTARCKSKRYFFICGMINMDWVSENLVLRMSWIDKRKGRNKRIKQEPQFRTESNLAYIYIIQVSFKTFSSTTYKKQQLTHRKIIRMIWNEKPCDLI